jgi:hypothetical protein
MTPWDKIGEANQLNKTPSSNQDLATLGFSGASNQDFNNKKIIKLIVHDISRPAAD